MSKNLIALVFLIIVFPVVAFAQTAKNDIEPGSSILDRQINESDFRWENLNIISALMSSFYSTRVPAGVSEIFRNHNETENDRKLNLSSRNLSLRNVLTEVTAYESHYQWKEEKGIINVFPKNDYPVLDTIIPEFNFENKTKEELLSELLDKKEFHESIIENQLLIHSLGINTGLVGGRAESRKFTINKKNTTVREILNEIVRQNGQSTWIYKEFKTDFFDKGNPKRYYKLYFLVNRP